MVEICPSFKDLLAFKFFILVSCDVFLLLPLMEEREGDDGDNGNGCWAPTWESGRYKISVFVTRLCCQEGWVAPQL